MTLHKALIRTVMTYACPACKFSEDPSPPTSAEVKKMWISASTPPYIFMA
jgi:hypothetical protein